MKKPEKLAREIASLDLNTAKLEPWKTLVNYGAALIRSDREEVVDLCQKAIQKRADGLTPCFVSDYLDALDTIIVMIKGD